MDSPNNSQDEFDLNLPFHHYQLKEKFNFLLEKSIASTKGSPLLTPENSILDLKSTFNTNFRRINPKYLKKTPRKLNVFDENVKLFDMVSNNTSISATIPVNSKIFFKNTIYHAKKTCPILKKIIEKKQKNQKLLKISQKKKAENLTFKTLSKISKIKWTEDETNLFYRVFDFKRKYIN